MRYTKCSVLTDGTRILLAWTWHGNSLEMGFTRARRYANHSSGRKYDSNGKVRPQESDWRTNEKAKAAAVFKVIRDKTAYDPTYKEMRKEWRANE